MVSSRTIIINIIIVVVVVIIIVYFVSFSFELWDFEGLEQTLSMYFMKNLKICEISERRN